MRRSRKWIEGSRGGRDMGSEEGSGVKGELGKRR
jgi:hypothetical protein